MPSDPAPETHDFDALTALAERAADAAGQAALPFFRRQGLETDNKLAGGFDPVTAADRGSETAIRQVLEEARPEDGIFGEEEAPKPSRSGLTWVIDPIDGTRSFISGLPTWGVLIALDDGASGILGLVDQPFTGERFFGRHGPGAPEAWLSRHGTRQPIAVRDCASIAEATLFTTSPDAFSPDEYDRFRRVQAEARLTRFGVDCYAYALVALGQIDLVVESGLAAYDIAAPAALVRAAGGVITSWDGGDPRWGGSVIAAGDARVHTAAMALLNG